MKPNDSADVLWHKLQQANVVAGVMPSLQEIDVSPWYLRVLQGFTGWFAALFLLGFFLTLFKDFLRQEPTAFILGALLIFAAYTLLRVRTSEFAGQFGLVLSLTGQCLVVFSWHTLLDNSSGWLLVAVVEALLAWFMPSFIHRFLTSYAAIWALVIACVSSPIIWLIPSCLLVAVMVLWLREGQWLAHGDRLRPFAYALTLALLQMHSLTMLSYDEMLRVVQGHHLADQVWLIRVNEVLLGGVLVCTIVQLLQRYEIHWRSSLGLLALGAGVLLALVSQEATGLAVAWTLILLGFANGNRVLLGLGVFTFWAYLGRYYYFLSMTLLDKSYLLMATGLLFLLIRYGMKKLVPEGDSHA